MNRTDSIHYRPLRTSVELCGAGVKISRQAPPPDLARFVFEFWQYDVQPDMDYLPVQVFPSGCVALRFDIMPRGVDGFVYGPSTNNRMKGAFFQEWVTFGVALRPERASHLLGLSLHELRDMRLHMDCLWPQLTRQIDSQMEETVTFAERVSLLSSFLRALLRMNAEPNADFLNAFQDIVRTVPRVDAINEIAKRHQLNHRTMRRYFHRYLGLGAKEMERVARVQGAMRLLAYAPQHTLAALADECGFADQSHLTREFRSIVGQSPKRFASLVGQTHDKTLPEWDGLVLAHRRAAGPKRVHRFE